MNISNDIWSELVARYEARHEPEQLRPLAETYWRGILTLSVACVVGALGLGVWQFVTVVENISSAQSAASVSTPSVLDRNKLKAVLNQYDDRAASYAEIQSYFTTVPDPSK